MVRFGTFEFDATSRRLLRLGAPVHLAPKTFELLQLLVDVAPRVVSKRELHARLWPGGIVADATLVALVKQLRRALHDPDHPQWIRTINRVGYALDITDPGAPHTLTTTSRHWLIAGDRRLGLVAGENIIGRDERAQVRFDAPDVSRQHLCITITPSGSRVHDLGSKNGTFVDGNRVNAPMQLRDGCRLAFGTVLAVYHETGAGAATLTHMGLS